MLQILGMTPKRMQELGIIQPEGVVRIGQEALRRVDSRMIEHGDRVAFLAVQLANYIDDLSENELRDLFQLALFHDIGAYKLEEISRLLTSLEGAEEMEHSLYGYLFLRYLSPLGTAAEAVLYHHSSVEDTELLEPGVRRNARLIHLADRVDLLRMRGPVDWDWLRQHSKGLDGELLELMRVADDELQLMQKLDDGSYRTFVNQMNVQLCTNADAAVALLSMLVYLIDFKSPVTVDHTINVIAFSVLLGKQMGLTEREQYALYLGALVHDIGKIAIPYSILENPGKLTTQQMDVMKTHVVITDEVLAGNMATETRRIAARHHEKPDGSGYPEGLTEPDLTLSERVMAVADVMSALLGQRSYKVGFDMAHTADIITRMGQTGKLDAAICKVAVQNLAYMARVAREQCQPIMESYHVFIEDYETIRGSLLS